MKPRYYVIVGVLLVISLGIMLAFKTNIFVIGLVVSILYSLSLFYAEKYKNID